MMTIKAHLSSIELEANYEAAVDPVRIPTIAGG